LALEEEQFATALYQTLGLILTSYCLPHSHGPVALAGAKCFATLFVRLKMSVSYKNHLKLAQCAGRAQPWDHIDLIYPLNKQGGNKA